MKVCGIIAEYDPFHRGHLYHLETARSLSGADYVVCVLSAAFLQRGAPALFPVRTRARMALAAGADAVFALPVSFSVSDAERFALGGVSLLHALGVVNSLAFGCETPCLSTLSAAADCLKDEPPDYILALKRHLAAGVSHAAAQGSALADFLGLSEKIVSSPNNALAICYLRALKKLDSPMLPLPVPRLGAHHFFEGDGYPSASAIRKWVLDGAWSKVESAVPKTSFSLILDAAQSGTLCAPDALDEALFYRLLSMRKIDWERLPNMSEGLENRFMNAISRAASRDALLAAVKTRRYPYARLSRTLTHALLGLEKNALPEYPSCARLLGFRQSALPLLHALRSSSIPIVSKNADAAAVLEQDARAEAIRALGTKNISHFFEESPIIY